MSNARYLCLTDSEKKAIELEDGIRNEYFAPYFSNLHQTEHVRAQEILNGYQQDIKSWSEFSEKTKTVLRSRKILQMSQYFSKHSPRLIVEFGAGASTYFVAHCLKRQYEETGVKGMIVSFEQSSDYYSLLNKFIPDDLKEYCDIRFSDVHIQYISEYLTVSYENSLDADVVDLVYVDGPATPKVLFDGKPRKVFSGDLVQLVNRGVRVRQAFTDVRWFNYGFFKDVLGDKFNVSANVEFKSVIVSEK